MVSDNVLIRKLYWTLRMNLNKSTEDEADELDLKPQKPNETQNTRSTRHNILNRLMLKKENLDTIEALVKVLKLSSEKRLSDLAGTFDCFEKALAIESDDVNTFISEAFLKSRICEDVDTFDWYRGHKLLTFSSNKSLISKKTILSKFKAQQDIAMPFFTKAI